MSDPVFGCRARRRAAPAASAPTTVPLWFAIVALAASVFLVVLSWRPLRNLFSRRQLMNASFNRWHLVNAYGAFGSVTKERYEVVVEGTARRPRRSRRRTGGSTSSRASRATCAGFRGSSRRTTCASTG